MNSVTDTALQHLQSVVGGGYVRSRDLAAWEVDQVRPAAVVRPGSAEEVAEIIRMAAAEKLAVIPCGARTKLRIGMPPARYDLALDMTRLDRVVAYDPDDLTLSVEPGLKLAKLLPQLASHKQTLPLALPYASSTTVGGAISSGVDSPLRQGYGTARDFVLGIEFVTGEGIAAKSGGRVVKNVAGYDLHKLLIGSLGTLGVITRVNFRTFPLPASRGFLASFPGFEGALELRSRIASSPLQPLTLDIISPEVAQLFAKRTPTTLETELGPTGPWLSTSEWTLAAGIGGSATVLERQAKDLTQMAEEARATTTDVLDDAARPLFWGRLREAIPMLLEEEPSTTILRIGALPTAAGIVLEGVQRAAEARRLRCATIVRGTGTIYAALTAYEGVAPLESVTGTCIRVFDLAGGLGGHASVPWCPTELKDRLNVWGSPRGDIELMRRLKQAFDPHGILSPGRFVGGL